MANQEHVNLLKQGVHIWNVWRDQYQDVRPNLSEADLRGANLSGADLSDADLSDADLSYADLSYANLGGADLGEANLSGAVLSGANLSGVYVEWTIFCDLDLRTVEGLGTLRHGGPSSIGIDTIVRSEGDIPEVFLRGAGLDDAFISYVLSLARKPIQYYTCFLSYSRKDQGIVDRLYADLQSRGVRCWYASHELGPGDYYRHKIEQSIRVYDKLVLILSEHSVGSEWVEKEVSTALKREDSMDMTRQVLFPLRLDDAVMRSKRSWVRSLRYHRHIADFTGWKQHDIYLQQFERLLSHLKAGTFEDVGL